MVIGGKRQQVLKFRDFLFCFPYLAYCNVQASLWLQLMSFALVDKLIPILYTGFLKSSNTGRPILYNDFQLLFTVVAICSPRLPFFFKVSSSTDMFHKVMHSSETERDRQRELNSLNYRGLFSFIVNFSVTLVNKPIAFAIF